MIEKVPRADFPPPLTGWAVQAFISFSDQEPEVEFLMLDTEGDDHRLHSAKWKMRGKGDWYTGFDFAEPITRLVESVVDKAMSVRPGSPKSPTDFFSGGSPPPKKAVLEAVLRTMPPFVADVRRTMTEALLSRFMGRWYEELSEEQIVTSWRNAVVRATMRE